MDRPKLTESEFAETVDATIQAFRTKLDGKGWHISVSPHEILGLTSEEFHEFAAAVHDNNHTQMKSELEDIAVACLLGIASINSRKMDW